LGESSRMTKCKKEQAIVESQIAQWKLSEDEIQKQVDLILELMENLQNKWFSFDFAKKSAILAVLAEQVILNKKQKNKPLIMWELPWKAIHAVASGSNMQGWYARQDSNLRPSDS
jgi:hypothetical protein